MQTVSVRLLGESARAVLERKGFGKVLSSHDTGLYCRFENNEILLVHSAVFGVIPFGLGYAPDTGLSWKAFPPDTVVSLVPDTRTVTVNGTQLCYAHAQTPFPSFPDLPQELLTLARMREGITKTLRLLDQDTVAARLMGRAEGLFAGKAPEPPLADMWEAALWDPLQETLVRCLASRVTARDNPASRLVGLGPGLTPLGDDILCGMAAAGHALAAIFPSGALDRLVRGIGDLFPEGITGMTTAQSTAYLKGAIQARLFGILDETLAALFRGEVETLGEKVTVFKNIGHTSGFGLLLGLLLAAELLLRERETVQAFG